MPRHVTPDGQVFDAPDHVIAAPKTLEDHAAGQAMAAKMFGAPRSGPSAIERHTAIREAQFAAEREGRKYIIPEAPPEPAPARTDLPRTLAERWGAWRGPQV